MSRIYQTIAATLVLAAGFMASTTAQACGGAYQPRTAVVAVPVAAPVYVQHTVHTAPAPTRKAHVHYVTKYDHYGHPYRAKVVTWKTVTTPTSHHRGW